MPDRDLASATQDFIFGTLATDNLRLEKLRHRLHGLHHGGRVAPADPAPGEAVRLTVTVGGDLSVETLEAYVTTDGSTPDETSPDVPFTLVGPAWDTLTWSYVETWAAMLPAYPAGTLVRYRIAATRPDGERRWADTDPVSGEPGLFAYAVDEERVPDWLREAVMYHIFVDRFAPSPGRDWLRPDSLNGIWGGTLSGIVPHLDDLADLGVTALWLSPVFPSPTHHGYDATDYDTIEPRLGTVEDLTTLIEAAHARGMRVLLDFVANHVSHAHPAFAKATSDPRAPERSWFTFRDDGSYSSFFGVESMPQVAVDHDAAADYLIRAAVGWLERGVDGFRLDYANGPSHAFWSRFRQVLRAVRPDCALIGEVVESAETMASYAGRLDGTLDFLLLQQLRAFLAFDLIDAEAFWRFLSRHLTWFPDELVLPSFLDNHDMNRFLWVVGGDVRRLKLAALVQFALPNPPIIFYGTEVGLSQWHDLEHPDGSRRMEESRTPMRWGEDQNAELKRFYRALIAWRRAARPDKGRPVLIRADADGLLAFASAGHVVAINRSDERRIVPLDWEDAPAVALATGPDVAVDGLSVVLPPMMGAVLTV